MEIVTRIRTDEPVVLVPIKEYMQMQEMIEDDYLEIIYKALGALYSVSNRFTDDAGHNLQESFNEYLKREFPYIKLGVKGRLDEKTQRLTVEWNMSKYERAKRHTEESKGEV